MATGGINKKAPSTPLNHIPLLRFRPGGVLQELVAWRRRKGKILNGNFYILMKRDFAQMISNSRKIRSFAH